MLPWCLAATLLGAVYCATESYEFPEPKFRLLKPQGFSVSIPDEDGIRLFAFHGNLNKEMPHMDVGQISKDVTSKSHGKWIYENKTIKLNERDVINYWFFVIKNGKGYMTDPKSYTVGPDFRRQSKKNWYHSRQKRRAHRPYFSEDGDDSDSDNEFEYGYPHPFEMRPKRPFNPYDTQWNPHRDPYPYKHNHHHYHHHCDHDFDVDTSTEKVDEPDNEAVIPVTVTPEAKPETTTPAGIVSQKTTPTVQTTTPVGTTFPMIDVRFGQR